MVNFAGSDSPIPATEQANFNGKTVLYFPVFLGPITVSYNLSGVTDLKLDATVLAGDLLREDHVLEQLGDHGANPGLACPAPRLPPPSAPTPRAPRRTSPCTCRTAGGSAWTLGSSSTIKWPSTSRAGNGNPGVAQIIKTTAGAIGYVDYSTAKASGLTFASIKNSSGSYIAPSPSAASAAGSGITVATNLTFHAVDSPNAQAYPITYQSWDLVYATQPNANDAAMLKAYIGYLLGAGQQLLGGLGYVPLPASLDQQAQAQLSKITG